jgi:quinoprotein glucose dehydrogenase
MTEFKGIALSVLCLSIFVSSCSDDEQAVFTESDWPAYGGQNNGNRYSTLTQINRDNVSRLAPAWQFDMDNTESSQTQPIVVDGVVYGLTTTLDVVALNGASGELLWTFNGLEGQSEFRGPSRGLSMWREGDKAILFAGLVDNIFAIDPDNGELVAEFGDDGVLDLRTGLPGDTSRFYVSLASPGIIYRDTIIVGFRTAESPPAAPGDIRAFDVRTGELVWSFHTIPAAGEFGADTWPENARATQGGANAWAGFALDEERGIVYVPTGSAAPDFFGGAREGDNLFANSLIALDATTGERIWHFQAVRHDIWDRDFPSPPSLVTVEREGRAIDAVAQTSKQGYVYLFDRVTGEPLFPIEERSVPTSTIAEEHSAPTQRLPTAPAPFARQELTADMLTTRSPELNDWAREQFSNFLSAGQFVPFGTEQPTVIFPGFDGGAEWGGSAIDPKRGIIYINSNDIAWTGALAASPDGMGYAEALYQAQCAVCHGIDRQGSPPEFPALTNVSETLSPDDMRDIIRFGRGRMAGFPALAPEAVAGLTDLLFNPESASSSDDEKEAVPSLSSDGSDVPYRFTGYHRFFDPDGYPAVAPPWGTLNAIDLNSGEYLWKIPFGEHPELKAQGLETTGSENYGGPVLTASGLLFIGATLFDQKFRAYDAATGELLWEYEMPYSGMATPAVYMVDGRQYVVISTSNSRNPKGQQGSAYIAFALPE